MEKNLTFFVSSEDTFSFVKMEENHPKGGCKVILLKQVDWPEREIQGFIHN